MIYKVIVPFVRIENKRRVSYTTGDIVEIAAPEAKRMADRGIVELLGKGVEQIETAEKPKPRAKRSKTK